MRQIVFDAGPIISLSTNNLLDILKPLKGEFEGIFLIPKEVAREVIEKPLTTKKFKFEALRVMKLVREGTLLEVNSDAAQELASELGELANNMFSCHHKKLTLLQAGEISMLAVAIHRKAEAVVVDERTLRLILEDPKRLQKLLEHRLKTKVNINSLLQKKFKELTKGIKVIRSTELVAVAFEKGFLDGYLANIPDARVALIDSLLWGLKLQGCSITEREIDQLKKAVL